VLLDLAAWSALSSAHSASTAWSGVALREVAALLLVVVTPRCGSGRYVQQPADAGLIVRRLAIAGGTSPDRPRLAKVGALPLVASRHGLARSSLTGVKGRA